MPGIHNPEAFARLRKRAGFDKPLPVFVETGTYKGHTLAAALASEEFDELHSVEISMSYWTNAKKVFHRHRPKVQVHFGDSADIVPIMLAQIPKPVFWYLDAHWWDHSPEPLDCPKDKFPLWNELAAIRARFLNEIVVVADIQALGAEDKRVPYQGWSGVTREAIVQFFGSRVVFMFEDDNRFVLSLRGC